MTEHKEVEITLGSPEDDEFLDQVLKHIATTKAEAEIVEDDENSGHMTISPPMPDDKDLVLSDISPESLTE